MAHFAQLDAGNVVLQVFVVDNNDILDDDGVEQESLGIAICEELFGDDKTYVQTSYNGNIRGHYAGIGDVYVPSADKFKSQAPHPNMTFDEDIWDWKFPTDPPDDSGTWEYDHDNEEWTQVPPTYS